MAVTASLVYGARIYWDTDSGYATAAELADMKSVGSPGASERPDVDVTPLYDTEDARQFSQGLATYGECEFVQFWTKTRMTALQTPYKARTQLYWRITFPDNAVVANRSKTEFRGRISKLTTSPFDDPDAVITILWTVKISGETTFTAGS